LAGLVLVLVAATYFWELSHQGKSNFLTTGNIGNLLTWVGLFGILSLGQAFVIITGGIDLSVGSVVGLIGLMTATLLGDKHWSPLTALPLCLAVSGAIGVFHGVLVTKFRLQPFIVTLCGLFLYRGTARLLSGDASRGLGDASPSLTWFGSGFVGDSFIPAPFVILLVLGILLGAFLHFMRGGRHLFALGANEESARFSGVRVHGLKLLAYVLCGLMTGVAAILLTFKVGSVTPSNFGNFYELYAIAGAVLGGCSLRGGSGSIPGILIGATLIVLLRNLVNILHIPSQVEYIVIGGAILVGVIVDELLGARRHGRRIVTGTEGREAKAAG
jgi:ribose transport system permease protein